MRSFLKKNGFCKVIDVAVLPLGEQRVDKEERSLSSLPYIDHFIHSVRTCFLAVPESYTKKSETFRFQL